MAPEPTYRLTVTYAAGHDQVHPGLTREQVDSYVRPEVGFMHDLLSLQGRGIRKLVLEVEDGA